MSRALSYVAPAVRGTAAPPIPKAKAWGAAYASSPTAGPLLDMSQGVPGSPPAQPLCDALSKVAGTHEAAKYGPILGEPALRAAMAEELRAKYGLKPDHLTAADTGITTGCNMAFLVLLMLLCPPGESSVLLPLPSYFNHAMSLSLQQVEPAYIPCSAADGFLPSLSAARSILESARSSPSRVRPRAIVLVTPNNPTGAVYPPAVLEEWYALARAFDVPLVLDETYRDFTERPHALFAKDSWRETLITVGSFSKGYRIPGHRLGVITAAPELLSHVATILDCMQICPPRAPQLALAPLLPSLRPDLAESAAALAKRLALFTDVVHSVPGWKVISSGGFYAYVEFPETFLSAQKALGLHEGEKVGSEHVGRALALQAGVLTLPGCFFMPALDDKIWESIKGGDEIKRDRWIRFAVANIDEASVKALGDRLRQLNGLLVAK